MSSPCQAVRPPLVFKVVAKYQLSRKGKHRNPAANCIDRLYCKPRPWCQGWKAFSLHCLSEEYATFVFKSLEGRGIIRSAGRNIIWSVYQGLCPLNANKFETKQTDEDFFVGDLVVKLIHCRSTKCVYELVQWRELRRWGYLASENCLWRGIWSINLHKSSWSICVPLDRLHGILLLLQLSLANELAWYCSYALQDQSTLCATCYVTIGISEPHYLALWKGRARWWIRGCLLLCSSCCWLYELLLPFSRNQWLMLEKVGPYSSLSTLYYEASAKSPCVNTTQSLTEWKDIGWGQSQTWVWLTLQGNVEQCPTAQSVWNGLQGIICL